MKQTPVASKSDVFVGQFRLLGSIWTHSYGGLHNTLPNHPQVREHEQGEELRRVPLQSMVAHLGITKLTLDDSEWVFYFGADTGFELFDFVQCGAQPPLFIQCLTSARPHCDMPSGVDVLDFFALGYALVASISIDVSLIPMHECVRLGYVVDIGGCANHRMCQTRVGVSANMRLHSVVPLIALLGLMHFRVTLARAVLSRARCGDGGGIDRCAASQHQAFGSEHVVDGLKELLGQVVSLHQVTWTWGFAKAQDADSVGHTISVAQASKGAVQRRIEQGFFHGEVAQTEQVLQQLKTQHGLVCKWRASGGLGRRHSRKLRYKLTPGHNAFHQFKQFHLAPAPDTQVEMKGLFVHAGVVASTVALPRCRRSFEQFP